MNWTLYGVAGWGSTLAEGALAWADEPFDWIDVDGFDRPGPARDRLLAVNPLARVPTLVKPDGTILTESAAIVLHLDELKPSAGLAPAPDHPDRTRFLNRLIWFVSTFYPTFSYRDYPERWAPSAESELVERIDGFRASLWRQFEGEINAGPFVLGKKPSALDLYVAVMSHWRPGRGWLAEHCPALHSIALAADSLPRLALVMERNFPR